MEDKNKDKGAKYTYHQDSRDKLDPYHRWVEEVDEDLAQQFEHAVVVIRPVRWP